MTNASQYAVSFVINAKQQASAAINQTKASFQGLRQQANITSRALGFPRVTSEARRFGDSIRAQGPALQRFSGNIRGLASSAALFGAAIGGVALGGLLTNTIARADQLAKTADRFGIGIEKLQELRFAAVREGAEEQNLDDGLRDLAKNIGEAANGGGEAVEVFKALNIQLIDSEGRVRGVGDVLGDISDRMQKIPDAATRVAVAQKLMGEGGSRLTNMLAKGRDQISAYGVEARALGIISEDQARQAELLADKQAALGQAFDGLGGSLMSTLVPALVPTLDFMRNLVTSQREVIASNIGFIVHDLAAGFASIDWVGVTAGIGSFISGVTDAVDFVGGWGNAILITAGIMHADLIVGLLRSAWAFGRVAIAATFATVRLGWFAAAQTLNAIRVFWMGMQLGVGVMNALKVAIMTNPIGLLVTLMATAAGLIFAYWEPIVDWFADLDIFKPMRRKIASFLETLPGFVREALNITDQDIAAIAGDGRETQVAANDNARRSSVPSVAPPSQAEFDSIQAQLGLVPTSGGGAQSALAVAAPVSAAAAAAAGGQEAQITVRFENAPAGMRVVSRSGDTGGLRIELDQGEGLIGDS